MPPVGGSGRTASAVRTAAPLDVQLIIQAAHAGRRGRRQSTSCSTRSAVGATRHAQAVQHHAVRRAGRTRAGRSTAASSRWRSIVSRTATIPIRPISSRARTFRRTATTSRASAIRAGRRAPARKGSRPTIPRSASRSVSRAPGASLPGAADRADLPAHAAQRVLPIACRSRRRRSRAARSGTSGTGIGGSRRDRMTAPAVVTSSSPMAIRKSFPHRARS